MSVWERGKVQPSPQAFPICVNNRSVFPAPAQIPSSSDARLRQVSFTLLCESGIRRDPAFTRLPGSALSRPASDKIRRTIFTHGPD
jgi:hypothetical protein